MFLSQPTENETRIWSYYKKLSDNKSTVTWKESVPYTSDS